MKSKRLKVSLRAHHAALQQKPKSRPPPPPGRQSPLSKPTKPAGTKDNDEPKRKKAPTTIPFTEDDSILLVGEGNFSFAHSLAEQLHGVPSILATSYDAHPEVITKYPDAQTHITAIEELGGRVLYSIDATDLKKSKALRKVLFTKIVFNFPHTGSGIKDRDRNVRLNQELIFKFLSNATDLLTLPKNNDTPAGQIHLTVKEGSPYDLWNVREQAKLTGKLTCLRSFTFDPTLYEEYSHRRTIGYKPGLSAADNEEIEKQGSRTYIFVRASDTPVAVAKRKKKDDDSSSEED
ncbi:hypothetical protein DFS34DRAFT_630250 [Phlyctochytrium arcticum]|nr:hypothetical protein DFS34DRAFT_630250 [Phlyctochytrium arcticum]